MSKYTADFETSTKPSYLKDGRVRVWAYAICEIGNPDNFIYGNSLDDFMEICADPKENATYYFHNLKFDASYIISWMLENGFEWIEDKKDRRSNTFTTLITEMGQFYKLEVFFDVKGKRTNSVTFLDSLKILNFSVEQIAKDFDLPIRKLEIDYDEYRPVGHILTPQEVDYIRNDVEIMARALNIMFEEGYTKMTMSSNALAEYKTTISDFNLYFPKLPKEIDAEIRKSYKGGFTYLSPKYKEQETGQGMIFDVNSLYPSILAGCEGELMPIGYPERFEGEYKKDKLYNLYVITFTCVFDLKKGKIPTIQDKSGRYGFRMNEYIESSNDVPVTLTLTSVDFELFKKHYNYRDIKYQGGWKFKSMLGLFNTYVEKHTKGKIQAKKEGKKAQYLLHKLLQNSLYGKFGLNPNGTTKQPYIEDGVVKYSFNETKDRDSIYIPIATFVTSYGRRKTITMSEAIREWSLKKYGEDFYTYSDTDSVHTRIMDEEKDLEDLKKIIDIDDYDLGKWSVDGRYQRGKYLRQKCYIEQYMDGTLHVTVAGLPKFLSHVINFDNFKVGFTTADLLPEQIGKKGKKLTYRQVKGGVLLEETEFTIK